MCLLKDELISLAQQVRSAARFAQQTFGSITVVSHCGCTSTLA